MTSMKTEPETILIRPSSYIHGWIVAYISFGEIGLDTKETQRRLARAFHASMEAEKAPASQTSLNPSRSSHARIYSSQRTLSLESLSLLVDRLYISCFKLICSLVRIGVRSGYPSTKSTIGSSFKTEVHPLNIDCEPTRSQSFVELSVKYFYPI